MNLELIANKLQDDGVGVRGANIFINHMPVTVTKGVLLRPPYIGTPIDNELPNYRKTRFNASVRAKTYQEANALATLVIDSLTVGYTVTPEIVINYIRPTTEPVSFPVSEGDSVEFLMIFEANYVIVV